MTHKISSDQLSLFQFGGVLVREATFLDLEGKHDPVPPQEVKGLGIQLEVRAVYSKTGDQAFVTLRVTLEPQPGKDLFAKLSASVEGVFLVRPGTERQRLQEFSTLQAPVLLVPYARQVITSLTAQSRMGAIVLPPLNMAEIIKQMREGASQNQGAQRSGG